MYTLTPQRGTQHHALPRRHHRGRRSRSSIRRGFANGSWAGEYGALRDIYNFKNTINASAALTAAQKSAALGFAETLEALMLFEIVQTRDTLGGITEIKENPFDLAPFVTRDSMYKYVLNTLDDAATKLAAGGAAFPFTLAPGFGAAVRARPSTRRPTSLKFNRGPQGEGCRRTMRRPAAARRRGRLR